MVRIQRQDDFFDLFTAPVCEAFVTSDLDKTAFLKDSDRGHVVPGGPGMQRPRDLHFQKLNEGLCGDSMAPVASSEPEADFALARPRGDETRDVANRDPVTLDGFHRYRSIIKDSLPLRGERGPIRRVLTGERSHPVGCRVALMLKENDEVLVEDVPQRNVPFRRAFHNDFRLFLAPAQSSV